MNTALWVAAGFLAAMMLIAGGTKAAKSKEQLQESGMAWVEDFPAPVLRAIGVAEILGAIGLIVPPLVGIAPILTPIAAAALAVTMLGAIIVHLRRGETKAVGMPVILLALAVFVAIGRFGPWAF